MKSLVMAAAVALFAVPASALTYYFDYSVGSSSGGYGQRYYDYATGSYGTGDIRVTGYIETDGTLGSVSAQDLVSWEFTLTGEHSSRTISSTPGSGYTTNVSGYFMTTADTLTSGTTTNLLSNIGYFYDANGRLETYEIGGVYNYRSGSRYALNQAYFYERDYTSGNAEDGEWARSYFLYNYRSYGDNSFVGRTISEVPLPASAVLLLAGLGGLGLMRRRRT